MDYNARYDNDFRLYDCIDNCKISQVIPIGSNHEMATYTLVCDMYIEDNQLHLPGSELTYRMSTQNIAAWLYYMLDKESDSGIHPYNPRRQRNEDDWFRSTDILIVPYGYDQSIAPFTFLYDTQLMSIFYPGRNFVIARTNELLVSLNGKLRRIQFGFEWMYKRVQEILKDIFPDISRRHIMKLLLRKIDEYDKNDPRFFENIENMGVHEPNAREQMRKMISQTTGDVYDLNYRVFDFLDPAIKPDDPKYMDYMIYHVIYRLYRTILPTQDYVLYGWLSGFRNLGEPFNPTITPRAISLLNRHIHVIPYNKRMQIYKKSDLIRDTLDNFDNSDNEGSRYYRIGWNRSRNQNSNRNYNRNYNRNFNNELLRPVRDIETERREGRRHRMNSWDEFDDSDLHDNSDNGDNDWNDGWDSDNDNDSDSDNSDNEAPLPFPRGWNRIRNRIRNQNDNNDGWDGSDSWDSEDDFDGLLM